MANNINVTVKRSKLIASVKTAIKKQEQAQAGHKADQAYNDKLKKDWTAKLLSKLGEPTFNHLNTYGNPQTISVTYTVPSGTKEPTYRKTDYSPDWSQALSALKNALTLLEMSDDETIKTSSYGSISSYL